MSHSSISNLSKDEAQKRWNVENFTNGNVVVKEAEMAQSVYIGRCQSTTVNIPNKVNKIVIDACTDLKVICVAVVSTFEIVRGERVEVRAEGRIPTLQIDISKGVNFFLTTENSNVKIITSSSVDLKMYIPKQTGEQNSSPIATRDNRLFNAYPIPASMLTEQRVTQIAQDGQVSFRLVTTTADRLKSAEGQYMVIESPKDMKRAENVTVEFTIQYKTVFGEIVFLIGSIPEIGQWKTGEAKRMEWTEGHNWKLNVVLNRNQLPFEYKYLILNTSTRQIRWEDTENRKLRNLPADYKITDYWEHVNNNSDEADMKDLNNNNPNHQESSSLADQPK